MPRRKNRRQPLNLMGKQTIIEILDGRHDPTGSISDCTLLATNRIASCNLTTLFGYLL